MLLTLVFCGCQQNKERKNSSKKEVSLSEKVNVFLGTSGDYGQLSPAASTPFNMISIGPVTNPGTHTGYDHYAKEYLGFVHTHIEGVGCQGGGGNILIKPLGKEGLETTLLKDKETAYPGYYKVSFKNGITAEMAVDHNYGVHHYRFPTKDNVLLLDLSHAFKNRFVNEKHVLSENTITGWVDTKTVCSAGQYRIYFYIDFSTAANITKIGEHQYLIKSSGESLMQVKIGFSSVNETYAKARVTGGKDLKTTQKANRIQWNSVLGRVLVTGEKDREDLFYALLYRGLQSPYLISEPDGSYRAIDGSLQKANTPVYHGWAIWDNYREQMPLLSMLYPDKYGDIARSIANLYKYGKKDWATMTEPSNTVRTEHAQVVLLDAFRKGHNLPLKAIKDSLVNASNRLNFGSPDESLESSYDFWAFSKLMLAVGDSTLARIHLKKAMNYKTYWTKNFADMNGSDVDKMGARGLYQGTLWQYRWFVPFDVDGLQNLAGGEKAFTNQLDQFFAEYNYNHANQPDLQVPGLYNTTKQPWKSQQLFRNIMLDTVVQYYFNNNSKGIDPYIGRIYKNKPKAYIRTMDDDMGTMSSWFVLRAMGLSPANVGEPIYYLTTPIFESVKINWSTGKSFSIKVSNYNKDYYYIKSVKLNGKPLLRNWLSHSEIISGGNLEIEVDRIPNKKWGIHNQWISTAY